MPRRQKIEQVLRKFAQVFHDEDSNDFKDTGVEHEIVLKDATSIRRPLYKTPFA